MLKTDVKERKVSSLSEFLAEVESQKLGGELSNSADRFLFRGQPQDKPLLPKLARGILPSGRLADVEDKMMGEFKRSSLPLGDMILTNEWDFLAIAQHHGMPTRMLDWTTNALAGLWFAVERGGESGPGSVVVWLLGTNPEDFIEESKEASPYRLRATGIYRPRMISRRIAAQGGLFTVHGLSETGSFIALEENTKFSGRLVKFKIPADCCVGIQKRLDECGINRFALFPELDGLCSHLAWLHTGLEANGRNEFPKAVPRRTEKSHGGGIATLHRRHGNQNSGASLR